MTENGIAPAPPDDDRTPTQSDEAPPIKPAEPWVMPQPVFRRSDGFTPHAVIGNEDPTITPETITTLEMDPIESGESTSEVVGDAPIVAEQPEVASESAGEAEAVMPAATVQKKGGFMRLLLMVLGIAIIAVAIGAIITGVVLWYFFQVSESQNLN